MTVEQIRELLTQPPFRAFELLLADGRSLSIEQPDLIVPTGDGRVVTIYRPPDQIEFIDLVSIRLRQAGLFDDSKLDA